MANYPDTIVIGPQRAGTTWIHQYFDSRGDIALPSGVKETFFFDRSMHRGADWYQAHFRDCAGALRIAEVAPTYFHVPETAKRIAELLGAVRLVCTLRDPVQRTFSLYLHYRRYGMTDLPFRQAVEQHPELIDSSRYAGHLQRWFDVFGRDRMLVLFLQDLQHDADAYACRLCDFMDIPYAAVTPDQRQKVNAWGLPASPALARVGNQVAHRLRAWGMYRTINAAKRLGLKTMLFGREDVGVKPRLSADDRLWLTERLHGEVAALEQLLNVELPIWSQSSEQQAAA